MMTTFRIMTYNVHGCIGRDGKISPYRIAEIIADYDPDIVALQELDVKRVRTGVIDQPYVIARDLKMYFHFSSSLEMRGEKYGNAVLSRFHIDVIQAEQLPTLPTRTDLEKRSALWVSARLNGQAIQVINTHLGLNRLERAAQTEALIGGDWLGNSMCSTPLIICGDFNTPPASQVYKTFSQILMDAQLSMKDGRPRRTYPSYLPVLRLDHIFASSEFKVKSIDVPFTRLTRTASDHLPLIAEMELE